MARVLVIIGAGGNAYDILDIVEALNDIALAWRIMGVLDDNLKRGTCHLGLRVLGRVDDAAKFDDAWFINAIGSDRSYRGRAQIAAVTGLATDRFATLVHPGASVSSRATVGNGVAVNHSVVVGGGAVIGDHVLLGPGCIVGHNSVIDDCSVLAAGSVISGFVHVGRNCYLGARSVVRQRLEIGEGALVGMGAVVVRDVCGGSTVVGNPAAVLEKARAAETRQG